MAVKTSIEWTRGDDGSAGSTWNPIRARSRETGKIGWYCEHTTPGCERCYSEAINRRLGTGIEFKRQNRDKAEVFLDEKILAAPLRWQRPRKIFVESMSDLFADFVLVDWIDRIFDVMEQCPHHTFIVLTKRAERMRDYFLEQNELIWSPASPPKWIWAGVSVEDQTRADERIPLLLDTPSAVRWISLEPMLGPVDFNATPGGALEWLGRLGWVVIGGESGPYARPFNIGWARQVIAECKWAGIPVFMKQLGTRPFDHRSCNSCANERPHTHTRSLHLRDRKGSDMGEWDSDLRVREYPDQERA